MHVSAAEMRDVILTCAPKGAYKELYTYSTGQKKGNTTIANDAKYTTVCAYIARKIFSSSILSRNRVHEVTNVGLTYAYMFAIANSEMREGGMRAN